MASAALTRLEESLPDDATRTRLLVDTGLIAAVTRTGARAPRWALENYAYRVATPAWLRLAGIDELACRFDALEPIVDTKSLAAVAPLLTQAHPDAMPVGLDRIKAMLAYVGMPPTEVTPRDVRAAACDAATSLAHAETGGIYVAYAAAVTYATQAVANIPEFRATLEQRRQSFVSFLLEVCR